MIKYVIQGKKNPLKKTEIKYYPQMAPSTPMTLAQIVKRVEKRSTVSSADVKAVLDALQYEVIEALENGNSVRLGDLGSFRLTMKSQGVETVAEAKKKGAQLIKKVNVQFTKSTTMRDTLTPQLLDFSIQEDIINASDGNSGGNPGGGSGGGSEHP
ncbi:DNA-binding protein [Prevotella intermedia]|uniref:Viral histone-like protein n=1 Tax=Prevotella intermedia TaxID=28131 RepID=A0AAJ3RSH1_PREIN|nr:HU family DNA-binding protein [Prevotella intermedia]ATV33008.1 DNA-binding protein [Prevotella intermedia]ATV40583.1 DNA-binding protein [Prevotella intermedia]ATV54715.1 DNA-binding protein [Prevotella intermedia]PJI20313.1 DNA-binding protein [Prevotella intermedia]